MDIVAHRGYWNGNIRSNSPQAIQMAMEKGYGFESDIRDYMGKLVISHNIACADSQTATDVFQQLAAYEDRCCFAINIKSDGLKDLLRAQLETNHIRNYFTFDMSVPQMVEYADAGLTYFTRKSEIEPAPILYEKASGVWVDGFWGDDWVTEQLLGGYIDDGKRICIVSSELHGRNPIALWIRMKTFQIDFNRVLLCTDIPDEANRFFRIN